MKAKILFFISILFFTIDGFSQQIGDGFAPVISDFTLPLNSGIYNGLNPIGSTPDGGWQHLFVIRHTNQNNNYQLQIGSSFSQDNRLFFRKLVDGGLNSNNPAWLELATRGENNFIGNQSISGNMKTTGLVPFIEFKPEHWSSSAYMQAGVNETGTTAGDFVTFIAPATKGYSFIQGAQSAVIINSNGNLGIGTNPSNTKLEILEASDSKPSGYVSPTKSILKLSRNGTPNYSYNENAEFRIGHGGDDVYGSKLDLYINGASNTNSIPDQHVMTWNYNGNVGIGTTLPLGKITLASIAQEKVDYGFTTPSSNWGPVFSSINFKSKDGVDADTDFSINLWKGTVGNGYGGSTSRFFINGSNGNVGIGTTIPGEKLTVNGTIHSTEVKVTQNVPADYVFQKYYTGESELKPDYTLLTLSEVEKFTKTNHHLPNMPSAKEIKENGLHLGEMSNILLQKIEEMTLYMIEMKKENEAIKVENKEIKKENEAFKSLSERLSKLENQSKQ